MISFPYWEPETAALGSSPRWVPFWVGAPLTQCPVSTEGSSWELLCHIICLRPREWCFRYDLARCSQSGKEGGAAVRGCGPSAPKPAFPRTCPCSPGAQDQAFAPPKPLLLP